MSEITFVTDDGLEETYYIIEQTILGGMSYILVADSKDEDEDANAMILKDVSGSGDEDACYVPVEDDTELEAVSRIFVEMLGDVDLV